MGAKKSSKTAVARRYAKALFEYANENKALDKVEADIESIGAITQDVPQLLNTLKNPVISRDNISTIFSEVTKKLDLNKISTNFFLLLGENRRLAILEEIVVEFKNLVAESRDELTVEVTSASALNDNQKKEIATKLKDMTGKTVDFDEVVDEEIIGGLIIKMGSQMLDNSINGKLERLRVLQKQAALPS